MKVQCKDFSRYWVVLFMLLLIPVLGGCSSLHPYHQIRYSTDPRIGIMKEAMSKEEAVGVLRIYVKDNTETKLYYDMLYLGVKLTEESIRANTIVTEESISYNTTSGMDVTDLDQTKAIGSMNSKGARRQSSFVMKYKDVKKMKLYTYKEIFQSFYKVYLSDESDRTMFWFSVPSKNNGEQKAYRLLAALSVLMPHVQEEYNEDNTQSYIDPRFK